MAFRSRRRSGARGAWFPTTTNFQFGNTTVATAAVTGWDVSVAAVPVIAAGFDEPVNTATLTSGTQTGSLLSVATRQTWTLKRLVGQLFVRAVGSNPVVAFAGLVKTPVSETGVFTDLAAWNPFSESSIQRRWMFRRFWFLGRESDTNPWPRTNAQYGSLREGTHVDSKVKARVEFNERLFLVLGAQHPSGTAAVATAEFFWNLRIFANMWQGGNR